MTSEQKESTLIPGRVTLWVCPRCGYWRAKKESSIHMDYSGSGPGEQHELIEVAYVLETPRER